MYFKYARFNLFAPFLFASFCVLEKFTGIV